MDAYQNADRYFALWERSLYRRQPEPCSLACAIRELHRAHSEGLVETIEGLPKPEEAFRLSGRELEKVTIELSSRYFPADTDFAR
jgi:hypothetical protein